MLIFTKLKLIFISFDYVSPVSDATTNSPSS